MKYRVEILPQAQRDFAALPDEVAGRIIKKLRRMENGVVGDVKRLSDFRPGWRLRVGDYRVLFDVVGDMIEVHRVKRRDKAYE